VRIYYKGYLKGAFIIAPSKATITKSQALGTPYILLSRDNYIRKFLSSLKESEEEWENFTRAVNKANEKFKGLFR